MAEIIIEAKALGRLRQECRDLHTRSCKLTISKGKLTASIFGSDNKGRPVQKDIQIIQKGMVKIGK